MHLIVIQNAKRTLKEIKLHKKYLPSLGVAPYNYLLQFSVHFSLSTELASPIFWLQQTLQKASGLRH